MIRRTVHPSVFLGQGANRPGDLDICYHSPQMSSRELRNLGCRFNGSPDSVRCDRLEERPEPGRQAHARANRFPGVGATEGEARHRSQRNRDWRGMSRAHADS